MKRGDIYIVKNRYTVGSEIAKARPAIIVSNDVLNATGEVVEVVYLTTKPKKEVPTHVSIQATGVPSTALCEQIDSVSAKLLINNIATCSEEEMAGINRALAHSLGLMVAEPEKVQEVKVPLSHELAEAFVKMNNEAIRAGAERDAYKAILERILDGGGADE